MRDIPGACPLDCPDGCSWVVTIDDDGKAVRVRGNPDHPFTRGGLCKKVNPWLEHAADPSRLLQPLRRIGPKGAARFEPIGWDEAIGTIAERFSDIVDTSGGGAIWPFYGTGSMGYVQGANSTQALWNRMGAAAHHLSICSPAGHAGLRLTMGISVSLDPEQVVDARTVVIWGSNTLVANQHWWPYVETARRNGARLVVVDPVATRTAKRADLHLAIRPGTDTALALAVCNGLIEREAHDPHFIGHRTTGFDQFAESIRGWTTDRAADVCDIGAAQIEELIDTIAANAPLAIKIGQGMQRHHGGGQAARAISCIPAVIGAFDQPGGGLVYSTSRYYQFNPAYHHTELGTRPRTLTMTLLAEELDPHRAQPVEALFVVAANPMVSNPDTAAVAKALSREDLFTVVVDVFDTETVAYADIVLPAAMQHEQLELNNSFAHFYANLNLPAVEPPGQCLPFSEIRRRLAAAMGYDEPVLHLSDDELLDELLDHQPFAEAGIDAQSLRSTGWARLPYATPWAPTRQRFPTPSGRFEFASTAAANQGLGLVPEFEPTQWTTGAGEYQLIAAASDWHLNSTFAGTQKTRSKTGTPPLRLNGEDAARDGLVDGDRVVVESAAGTFDAVVAIDASSRPGLASTDKGWWRQGVNNVMGEARTDVGDGPVYHGVQVSVRLKSSNTSASVVGEKST
ncbi:MAG: molybdopterin-dependent oxidoreductase [Acidimicrobiales bacterium]|nr:molybdopterin-dependent oxidoreductase [Acidimicrobiales bacterium]